MLTGSRSYRLVLWDVDHTLMETRGVGSQLFKAAFETTTEVPLEHRVTVTGQTEPAIFGEALRLHHVDRSEELLSTYLAELARLYRQHADQLSRQGRALPGAHEALSAVAQLPGTVQTVLTGNLRAVAEVKLHTFGLDAHLDLDVGAYGDDSEHRPSLVAVAQLRAGANYEAEFGVHNSIIIGDTIQDVRTAQQGGATIIGVATGHDSIEDLHRAGARVVLRNLTDASRLLDAITKATSGR